MVMVKVQGYRGNSPEEKHFQPSVYVTRRDKDTISSKQIWTGNCKWVKSGPFDLELGLFQLLLLWKLAHLGLFCNYVLFELSIDVSSVDVKAAAFMCRWLPLCQWSMHSTAMALWLWRWLRRQFWWESRHVWYVVEMMTASQWFNQLHIIKSNPRCCSTTFSLHCC